MSATPTTGESSQRRSGREKRQSTKLMYDRGDKAKADAAPKKIRTQKRKQESSSVQRYASVEVIIDEEPGVVEEVGSACADSIYHGGKPKHKTKFSVPEVTKKPRMESTEKMSEDDDDKHGKMEDKKESGGKNFVCIPSLKSSALFNLTLSIATKKKAEPSRAYSFSPMIDKYSYIVKAVEEKDLGCLAALLKIGGDANLRIKEKLNIPLLLRAVELGDLNCVHVLLSCANKADVNCVDSFGVTALMMAGAKNNCEMVSYLMSVGADPRIQIPNKNGTTALHAMAKEDSEDAVRAMCLAKDLKLLEMQDEEHMTPLMVACKFKGVKVVKLLTDLMKRCGVENLVNMMDIHGGTAMHWAAIVGNDVSITDLIRVGAEVNKMDGKGDTPLHLAVSYERCVQALVNLGADPTLKNFAQMSVFDSFRIRCKSPDLLMQSTPVLLSPPKDVSEGREGKYLVRLTNKLDSATIEHGKDFVYISQSVLGSSLLGILGFGVSAFHHCSCLSSRCLPSCSHTDKVVLKYGQDFKGRLQLSEQSLKIQSQNLVLYECNQFCSCNLNKCSNRVIQNGIQHHFEVIRTKSKGWALLTRDTLYRGDFVCELAGEIMSSSYSSQVMNKTFLYEFKDSGFCIDSSKYGNVSRFANHSCDPNLFPVKVFIDTLIPRVALFALRDITRGEELTLDYTSIHFDSLVNAEGKRQLPFACKCEASKCRAISL